jgi:hypothetical protein
MLHGEDGVSPTDRVGQGRRTEEGDHGLAAGGAGQFLGLAHQLESRIGQLTAEVVGQDEDVVRHRDSLT